MPGPFNHHAADGQRATILWLPKSNDRSVIVASELRQAGFFDMTRHFLSLLNRQSAQLKQWEKSRDEQVIEPRQQDLEHENAMHYQPMRPRMSFTQLGRCYEATSQPHELRKRSGRAQ